MGSNLEFSKEKDIHSDKREIGNFTWSDLLNNRDDKTGEVRPKVMTSEEFKKLAIGKLQEKVEVLKENRQETVDIKDISDCNLEQLEKVCVDEGLASYVDFHDFDVRVARSLVQSLRETKKDFPQLKIGYLGSCSSQIKGIHESIAESYFDLCRTTYGEKYSDVAYKECAKRFADEYIKKYGLESDDAYAWSLSVPEQLDPTGNGLQKFNGIAINSSFASNYDYFLEAKEREISLKHKPINCDTPKATCDHELGHEIARKYSADKDSYIRSLYQKMMTSGRAKEELSGYATTNVDEFIAEAYSEYRNNPKPRYYSTAVYNRLVELRNQNEKRA